MKIYPISEKPNSNISKVVNDILSNAILIKFSIAFITKEGLNQLKHNLRKIRNTQGYGVVAINYPTNVNALNEIYELTDNRLWVHTGWKNYVLPLEPIRPLMHTKIIYTEQGNGLAIIYIGSHNWTANALLGCNYESGIIVECTEEDKICTQIENQIEICRQASELFDPNKIDFYKHAQKIIFDRGKFDVTLPEFTFYEDQELIIHLESENYQNIKSLDSIYIEFEEELAELFIVDRKVCIYCYDKNSLFNTNPNIEESIVFVGKITASNRTEFHPTNPDKYRQLPGPQYMITEFSKPIIELIDFSSDRWPHCQGVIRIDKFIPTKYIYHDGKSKPTMQPHTEIESEETNEVFLQDLLGTKLSLEKINNIDYNLNIKVPLKESYSIFLDRLKDSQIIKYEYKDKAGTGVNYKINISDTGTKYVYLAKYKMPLEGLEEVSNKFKIID
ncbi:MAG: phospholipase D-like domain-containing protein [bacterium]